MSSCNLAETIHNKWLQQSRNLGNDLYVATIDDFVRAFLKMIKYYQYLKGSQAGTGPSKEELNRDRWRELGMQSLSVKQFQIFQECKNMSLGSPISKVRRFSACRRGKPTCLFVANLIHIGLTR